MDFVAVMDQAIALLRQRGRLTYRTLQWKRNKNSDLVNVVRFQLC